MVFFIRWGLGFDRGDKRVKIAGMKRYAATFWRLGDFGDRCEEGVWVIWGSKSDNS